MRPLLRGVASSSLLALICLMGGSVWAQQSENFKLKRLTVSTVGQRAESASFKTTVTASDVTGSAGVCPSGLATTAGFLALRGTAAIEVRLSALLDPDNPVNSEAVDFFWTGQAPEFTLYRSSTPEDVVGTGSVVAAVPACTATDAELLTPPPVFYYQVSPSVL